MVSACRRRIAMNTDVRTLLLLSLVSPLISLQSTPRCGSPVVSSVAAHGVDAVDGEWPWQVAIYYGRHFSCGGSLITEQWVLSAAHCFKESSDPKSYLVSLGMYQLDLLNPPKSSVKIKEIIKHQLYKMIQDAEDIALVKLVNPVNLTDYIQPICLPDASITFSSGLECWVTGWGSQSSDGESSILWDIPNVQTLQAVMTPLIDHKVCNLLYHISSSVDSDDTIIHENMICAGYITGEKDSCKGFSGGPLVCNVDGTWIQAGVVSWGEGCRFPYRPGVYVLVTAYVPWMKMYIPNMTLSSGLNIHTPSTGHGVCGFPVISNRIFWSNYAVEGEFPWQISVQYHEIHICGGSLISDRWILSAAFCFSPEFDTSLYRIYLGVDKIIGKTPYEQSRTVYAIIPHPLYSGPGSYWDIALIELFEPIYYSIKVLPICLPAGTPALPNSLECWVTGWVNAYSIDNFINPKSLQKVKVSMDKLVFLKDTIWFSDEESQKDLYKAGSGDPLVCKVNDNWFQVSIMTQYSLSRSPMRSTLLHVYQSWIKSHVPDIIFIDFKNDQQPKTLCEGKSGTDEAVSSCSASPSVLWCGSPVIFNHIADTTDTVDGEWPWQVAVYYNDLFICGGSLINEQWVLSAAHCFDNNSDSKSYKIIMGVIHLSGHMRHAKHSVVTEIIQNPKHKAGGSRGDIALLKLPTPISYTNYIKPICLPAASVSFASGMECWVTTWNFQSSKTLQKVKLSLIDDKRCNKMYHDGSKESYTIIIQNDKTCAGYTDTEGRKDSCQGDSGAPLVCRVEGTWIQAGIAIKKKGCGLPNHPRVYTLLPIYESWIKRYIPEIRFVL